MPYEDSPYFETPCHKEPLWRYMHIDKFIAMLHSKTIYFPNIYSFNDKYEGTLTKNTINEIRKISLFDENNILLDHDEAFYRKRKSLRDPLKQLDSRKLIQEQENIESVRIFEQLLSNFLSHLMYCNSWFESKIESHTMWAQYGDKSPTSVAIQTTIGDLICSLKSDKYKIHIGKVKYKDYLKDDIEGYDIEGYDFESINLNDPNDILKLFYAPFLHKRDIFKDEHEVRAIISFEDVSKEFLGRVYTSKIPYYRDPMFRTDVSLLRDYQNPINNAKNGISINVNLRTLLKKIVVSPTVNDYFNIHFKDLIKRYNIDPDIIKPSQIVDIQEDS